MLILGVAAVPGLLIALAAADAAGQPVHSPICPPGLSHRAWVVGAVSLERPAFAVAFIGWSPLFALHLAGGATRPVAKPALLGLGALGYLRLTRDAWDGRARLGWLAAALVIVVPAWLVPWYGSRPAAFAAV